MTTLTDVKIKSWTAAVPCKVSDNIVSSQFSSQKVFVPSYEKEKRPCIEQLLTNEYQRIWWQEKEAWDKRHASKKTSSKKLLQHKIIKKKPTTVPIEKPKLIKNTRKRKEATAVKTSEKATEEKQEVLEQKAEKTEGVELVLNKAK
ncbi:uncharacterized protein LOC143265738 isoform X2 [Megachile rotundata]|uniref:uncharacterized protein LOC143265738 isoform X2 n=1 Tax=Megachile rotundata TaxID=143995 RepID=UPI003FD4F625